jgi:hypothetical protein
LNTAKLREDHQFPHIHCVPDSRLHNSPGVLVRLKKGRVLTQSGIEIARTLDATRMFGIRRVPVLACRGT